MTTKPPELKIGHYYEITLSGKSWRGLVVGIHEQLPGSPIGVTVGIRAENRGGTYLYDDIANNAIEIGPAYNVEELRAIAIENDKIFFELKALYLARERSKPPRFKASTKKRDILKELSEDITEVLNDYLDGKRVKDIGGEQ